MCISFSLFEKCSIFFFKACFPQNVKIYRVLSEKIAFNFTNTEELKKKALLCFGVLEEEEEKNEKKQKLVRKKQQEAQGEKVKLLLGE